MLVVPTDRVVLEALGEVETNIGLILALWQRIAAVASSSAQNSGFQP